MGIEWRVLWIMAVLSTFACKPVATQPTSEILESRSDRASWLNQHRMPDNDICPVVNTNSCQTAYVIVELPHFDESSTGHTAFAMGRKFFDFGPAGELEKGYIVGGLANAPGGSYWGSKSHPGWKDYPLGAQVELPDVIANITKLAPNYTTIMIPMALEKAHAQATQSKWNEIANDPPTYQVPGMHCTSSTARCLEQGDPNRPWRVDAQEWMPLPPKSGKLPIMYAKTLLSGEHNEAYFNYTHRCGPQKGQPLKAIILNTYSKLGVRPHTNFGRCDVFRPQQANTNININTNDVQQQPSPPQVDFSKRGQAHLYLATVQDQAQMESLNKTQLTAVGGILLENYHDKAATEQRIRQVLANYNLRNSSRYNGVRYEVRSQAPVKDPATGRYTLPILTTGNMVFDQP